MQPAGMLAFGVTLFIAIVTPSHATGPVARRETFLDSARTATSRYRDVAVAIGDGYRLVGEDFPGLGEHWVNLATLAGGELRADAPPVLIYVRRKGEAILAGVAYTAFLRQGEAYPDLPAPARYWHEHNGSIAEASLPLSHHQMHSAGTETRLAVLHAWIWLENPAGVWEPDNWSLPFHRLELSADSMSGAAARAATLAADGGADYYARTIVEYGALSEADARAVRASLRIASPRAAAIIAGVRAQRVSAAEVRELADVWVSLCRSIAGEVSKPAALRLSPMLDHLLH